MLQELPTALEMGGGTLRILVESESDLEFSVLPGFDQIKQISKLPCAQFLINILCNEFIGQATVSEKQKKKNNKIK